MYIPYLSEKVRDSLSKREHVREIPIRTCVFLILTYDSLEPRLHQLVCVIIVYGHNLFGLECLLETWWCFILQLLRELVKIF